MLPSIGTTRQDFNFRNEYINNMKTTLLNDSERLNKLKKINLFNSNFKDKEVQPFVEKFDKSKFVPPDFYFVRRYVDGNSTKSHDKKIASYNERKTINQNNVQDRLLSIKRKYLDRQLDYNQMQIKRERSLLLDKYLEAKAANYNLTKTKIFSESAITDDDNKSIKYYRSKFLNDFQSSSDIHLTNKNTENSTKIKPTTTSVSEKFVEQQRKYLPNYKRKQDGKRIIASADIDQFIDKGRRVNESNRTICSKFKTHVLAKYRAEYFSNNKVLFREFPDLHELLEQFNNALNEMENNNSNKEFSSLKTLANKTSIAYNSHI